MAWANTDECLWWRASIVLVGGGGGLAGPHGSGRFAVCIRAVNGRWVRSAHCELGGFAANRTTEQRAAVSSGRPSPRANTLEPGAVWCGHPGSGEVWVRSGCGMGAVWIAGAHGVARRAQQRGGGRCAGLVVSVCGGVECRAERVMSGRDVSRVALGWCCRSTQRGVGVEGHGRGLTMDH